MNVYILILEYKNSAHLIEIIGVYSHYLSAIEAADKRRPLIEFSYDKVYGAWESGWSEDKDPTRFLVREYGVRS